MLRTFNNKCRYKKGTRYYSIKLLHAIIVCCESLNLSQFMSTHREKILSILLLIFSAACVVSSVLFLIGIWMDCRDLLIPWVICVIMTTILDSFYCLYLVFEAEFPALKFILVSIGIIISLLNVYCVISQLRMYYMADRSSPVAREIQAPEIQEPRREEYPLSSTGGSTNYPAATHNISVVHQSSEPAVRNEDTTIVIKASRGDPVAIHSSTVAEIHSSVEAVRNEDKSLENELQQIPDNHRDNENQEDLMKDCKEVLNDLIEKMMEGVIEPTK